MNAALAWSDKRMSETRGEYHTGTAGEASDAAPENLRTLPARGGFTQVDNSYLDGLWSRLSPIAHLSLIYIVRNTYGYRRDSVRLSFKQLGDALGVSRNTAMKALQELEAAHIIGSDGSERGRTQVRAYYPLPATAWTLPPRNPTSAENELVTTSPKTALVVSKIALVGAQTSAKIGHPINTENLNTVSKDNTDANASGAATSADATPDVALPASEPSPSKKPTTAKPRELSPKDQYRVDLLARVAAINDGAKPPNRAQEWAAAARFWTWGKDGAPADIEQVAACYAEERRRPKWDSGYLSLQSVYSVFAAFLRNPDGFRKAIDRARAAADGILDERSRTRGETRHAPDHPTHRPDTASASYDDDAGRFPDPFERTNQRLAAAVAEKRAREAATAIASTPPHTRQ